MLSGYPNSPIRLDIAERRTIAILLLIYALAYLDRQILTLLVDPIRADLAVSDVEMGFLQGMGFTLSFALCGPLVGWTVDRYSRRLIIFIGIIVWSLSTVSSAFADTYIELLVARFGVGAGEAALLPAAYSIISDMVEKARLARAMAVFSLGSIVGGALSYALGGALITYASSFEGLFLPVIGQGMRDWQLVFLAIGSVGVPMAFLVFAFPDPGRRRGSHLSDSTAAAPRAGLQHFKAHWRFYVCHFSAFSLFCFLSAATTAWSATYMMREFNWTPASAGTLLGMKTLVGGAVGILGSGLIADRLVKRGRQDAHFRMYLYILPVHALVGAITFTTGKMWIAFVGLGMLATVAPFIAVAAAGLQLGTIPERRGIASACFLLLYNLVGFGLGPAFIAMGSAVISDEGADLGPALALSYVIVPPIIMLFLALGLRPMRTAVAHVSGSGDKERKT